MIESYRRLEAPRIVGMISGTSVDGIDAALVQLENGKLRLLRFLTMPYPEDFRPTLFGLMEDRLTVRDVARANVRVGQLFAQAALQVLQGERADLIASHGQTIAHLPDETPASTLQIGEPSILAEGTRTLTVSDFRPADLALGGQAAPLVPYFDHFLLHDPALDRVAVNIGGMGNLSWVPRSGPVLGWDSGPGNVVMDALAERFLGQPVDRDGAFAATGTLREELLAEMLQHPYFRATGPKSTGREAFGRDWIEPFLGRAEPRDLMRTACVLTAETLLASLRPVLQGPFEMVVGGGGFHNKTLMDELRARAGSLGLQRLVGFEEFGITADSREACAFALMGHETIWGRPSSVPSVTGASRPAILGRITFPSPEA